MSKGKNWKQKFKIIISGMKFMQNMEKENEILKEKVLASTKRAIDKLIKESKGKGYKLVYTVPKKEEKNKEITH
jgi:hypothetical protein